MVKLETAKIVYRIKLLLERDIIRTGKAGRKLGNNSVAMILATHLFNEYLPVDSPFNNPTIKEYVLTGTVNGN